MMMMMMMVMMMMMIMMMIRDRLEATDFVVAGAGQLRQTPCCHTVLECLPCQSVWQREHFSEHIGT